MKSNKQKFHHYCKVVLDIVYISGLVYLLGFTISAIVSGSWVTFPTLKYEWQM